MALTPPPAIPQRADRATFSDRVDAFLRWFVNLIPELNVFLANLTSAAAGGAYSIPFITAGLDAIGSNKGYLALSGGTGTQAAATLLYTDLTDAAGRTIANTLATFGQSGSAIKGTLKLVKVNDPSRWLLFQVTQVSANSQSQLHYVTGIGASDPSPFMNGENIVLQFTPTGDKGDVGAASVLQSARISDRKGSNTPGGAASANNVNNLRALNTIEHNTISGLSLTGNVLTVPAGTYEVWARAPAYQVGSHKIALYNNTDGANAFVGSSAFASASDNVVTDSVITGARLVLNAAKSFNLRHYVQQASGNNDLGVATANGQTEVYSEIYLLKVA